MSEAAVPVGFYACAFLIPSVWGSLAGSLGCWFILYNRKHIS